MPYVTTSGSALGTQDNASEARYLKRLRIRAQIVMSSQARDDVIHVDPILLPLLLSGCLLAAAFRM